MSADIFLAVSFSYLKHALSAAHSFQQHHDDSHAFILVWDVAHGDDIEISPDLKVTLFGHAQLEQHGELFSSAFGYMNVFEMSNLAKYVGLHQLLKWGISKQVVVYFDSDIMFFAPAQKFWEPLYNEHVAVFTPHHLGFNDDRESYELLQMGPLNAGVFAVDATSPLVTEFLEKIARDITAYGLYFKDVMFADQPSLTVNVARLSSLAVISGLPGMNVAYWNYQQRPLSVRQDRFYVKEEPLLCFHFSGFSIDEPKRLSSHQDSTEGQPSLEIVSLLETYYNFLKSCNFGIRIKHGKRIHPAFDGWFLSRLLKLKKAYPNVARDRVFLWFLHYFSSRLVMILKKLAPLRR